MRVCGHPSRLAEDGEHLRMRVVIDGTVAAVADQRNPARFAVNCRGS
jgi:hypothetical protein